MTVMSLTKVIDTYLMSVQKSDLLPTDHQWVYPFGRRLALDLLISVPLQVLELRRD